MSTVSLSHPLCLQFLRQEAVKRSELRQKAEKLAYHLPPSSGHVNEMQEMLDSNILTLTLFHLKSIFIINTM